MPKPRKRQVSLADTPYYHCISRCVRRAYLCGKDPLTGYDYSHRRGWIVARLKSLSHVFAMDLCAYAVMSNHFHVVLRVNVAKAARWSDREVAEQWLKLFAGPPLMQRWMARIQLEPAELDRVRVYVETWRQRLGDLSWFMRCLNESIARLANAEDRCTGRFWEGRFKSQALLDERALLACMAYVDLNPIRAAMASTPEKSDYTSVQDRIAHPNTSQLMAFSHKSDDEDRIPFPLKDYLELVDWSGRAIRSDKKGYIPKNTPPILSRLGMAPGELLDYLQTKPDTFNYALGPVSALRNMAQSLGLSFLRGITLARALCPQSN